MHSCLHARRGQQGRLLMAMSHSPLVQRIRNLWRSSIGRTKEPPDRQADAIVACSKCFRNEGLRLDAERLGTADTLVCPGCRRTGGSKLTRERLITLASEFFVWGSVRRYEYGEAPAIQFNDRRRTDPELATELGRDLRVFEETLGFGFFLYGPRAWMWGEVEPLKRLQDDGSRDGVIQRIVTEYSSMTLTTDDQFYRVRKNPRRPAERAQYDSSPPGKSGGRLASAKFPVLYGSPDLDTCLHECRVAVEDELYVATLRPTRDLKLLNVAAMLDEPEMVTEFESLDLAVYHAVSWWRELLSDSEEYFRGCQAPWIRWSSVSVILQHDQEWGEAVRDDVRDFPPEDFPIQGV